MRKSYKGTYHIFISVVPSLCFVYIIYIYKIVAFPGDKVACMVNNLGGLSLLEMNIVAGEVISQLGISISTVKPCDET